MFNRDSLSTIVERTKEDMLSRLTPDELLRRSDAAVSARVLAGMAHEMLGYLDWISRQVLYDTSDEDILVRQGSIWKVPQKQAEFAVGTAAAVGVSGRTIPDGAVLRRADGAEFVVQGDVTIADGVASVPVKAAIAGEAGNTVAGTILMLLNPVDGVQSQMPVAAGGLVNGSDVENVSTYRARFLRRLGAPPSGGTLSDYESWALEVPGVTRAWATSGEMGPGTVTVRFVRDDDDSIIPDPAEVQAVQDYIDARRPATAEVFVVAPIAVPLTFQIELTPGSVTVKAAVVAELKDLLRRSARPAGTLFLSQENEAISTAAGEEDHVLVFPTANQTFGVGEMPIFGEVVWL